MTFVLSEGSTYCELEVYISTCVLRTADLSQTLDRHNHWESAASVITLLLRLDCKCLILIMNASQVNLLSGINSFVSYHPCARYSVHFFFFCQGLHRVLCAGSRAARVEVRGGGTSNHLNYYIIFYLYIKFKKYGRGPNYQTRRAADLILLTWTVV